MLKRLLSSAKALQDKATLGTQTAVVAGFLCVILSVTVALTAALMARSQTKEHVEGDMTDLALEMAERLDARMFERYREIRNIADLQPLRAIWSGEPAVIRGVLEKLQSSLPEYAWVGLAAPDGTVRAATKGMLEGKSVSERPWFKDGLKGPSVEDVHGAKLLSSLLGPPPEGEPFRFVDVAMPVHAPNGALTGVLAAHMSWSWASDVRRSVLQSVDAGQQAEIWVLAADGTMLLGPQVDAHPFDAETIAAIKSTRHKTFVDASAEPMLTAAALTSGRLDYPGLGWIVIVRRPLAEALAPADHLATVILLVGLLMALASRLTRPLRHLSRSVDSIGRDPSVTMIPRQQGSRDVLQLSVSIRSLLRRLGTAETAGQRARNEALEAEKQLAEKTRRLGEDLHALQILADTDPLTHLLNRRAFLVFAEDTMNYYHRYKRDVGVLVVDVDFFKRVNDTHGHATGDEVIRAVGETIAREARTTDKVARFGGEEFVVLLRETDDLGAAVTAERIREKIAQIRVEAPNGPIRITASVGVAMAVPADRDIEDVIERADKALYRAKSTGRDCVVLADSLAHILNQAA